MKQLNVERRNSMPFKEMFEMFLLLLALSVDLNHCYISTESEIFTLNEAHKRYVRAKCLQQFPQAEPVNYTDTLQTHCYMHCFLNKIGLMDLSSRGLDGIKFIDIWYTLGQDLQENNCLDIYDFSEALSGTCSDTYRKLMELRNACFELFDYTFNIDRKWNFLKPGTSKIIGQSASDFCESIENKVDNVINETSQDNESSLLSQYKDKLKCIFENIHYLDAYGRIDEDEINLSYREALEDSSKFRPRVNKCCHRGNSKYQKDYVGNSVLELQKCLKSTTSKVFDKVLKVRDENSRHY